jgi:hypothetical protein
MEKASKVKHSEAAPATHAGAQRSGTMQFRDRRASTAAQHALQRKIQESSMVPKQETTQLHAMISNPQAIQRKENSGLPTNLRSGIESLSGMDMGGVKVHYNSSKPAQLQAHAYAQGNSIHLGPGQEKHLPHEAWHVVQQKQGRVKPTMQLAKININDDKGLEGEADRMGAKAMKGGTAQRKAQSKAATPNAPAQRMPKKPAKGKKK